MARLLIFGPGYTASHIIAAAQARSFAVETIDRARFKDDPAVVAAIAGATHILSSVPPESETDPVLDRYGAALATTTHQSPAVDSPADQLDTVTTAMNSLPDVIFYKDMDGAAEKLWM